MVTTKKATGRAMSIPGGLALSTAVSLGVTLILSAVVAKMVDAELMGEGAIGYGVLITLLTSAIAGAAFATALSQAVGGALPLIYFFSKNKSNPSKQNNKYYCNNGNDFPLFH